MISEFTLRMAHPDVMFDQEAFDGQAGRTIEMRTGERVIETLEILKIEIEENGSTAVLTVRPVSKWPSRDV